MSQFLSLPGTTLKASSSTLYLIFYKQELSAPARHSHLQMEKRFFGSFLFIGASRADYNITLSGPSWHLSSNIFVNMGDTTKTVLVDCICCAFGNDFIKQGLMVVGGFGGRSDLSSTEVYLPSTKRWTKSAGVLPRHVREEPPLLGGRRPFSFSSSWWYKS